MLSLRSSWQHAARRPLGAVPRLGSARIYALPFLRAKSDAGGAVPEPKAASSSAPAQTFGFLVRDEHLAQRNGPQSEYTRSVQLRDSGVAYETQMSPFRNEDGSFVQGETAEEARLDPRTLDGRVDSSAVHLPAELAKVINKNILSQISPDKLRERAATIFQSLDKEQIQKAPESSLDADAHIAALFLQNYAHSVRVLKELRKRVPGLSPDSVLDIGYGPATGMLALNELMGPEFRPAVKEAYIVGRGNKEMKKRAKILLSRQINEIESKHGGPYAAQAPEPAQQAEVGSESGSAYVQDEDVSSYQGYIDREGDFVGPVDAAQLRVRTRLRDALPSTKQYELIMVNQSLLSREFNFPRDVDLNVEMILRLLAPGGHLVILERGNALGFEIVARARQVMLRPESYRAERGRIPRPYIRGSSVKPQKLRREDQIITDDHVDYERELLARLDAEAEAEAESELSEAEAESEVLGAEAETEAEAESELSEAEAESEVLEAEAETEAEAESELSEAEAESEVLGAEAETEAEAESELSEASDADSLEQELLQKFGPVSEEELKFEFENDPDFELSATPLPPTPSVDYHLSVVAPCSHHGQCPLQLGDPKFYQISDHKHRLQFCSFNQVVHRPKYTMELKKGKRLATKWDKSSHDGFGTDKIARSTLKGMQGTGRTGGNNTESGNLSYLIMHRAQNDPQTIAAIEDARAHNSDTNAALPRILEFPSKVKKNVRLKVCAPSGNVEYWQIPKSLGKQTYHDARKAKQGDLWALDKKSAVVKSRLSAGKVEKLNKLANMQRKFVVKEKRKRDWKKLVSRQASDFDDPLDVLDDWASDVETSKKYRTEGKRANFDVNPREYDGN